MMRETFEAWSPRGEAAELVDLVNEICRDYASQGYNLTLRQLYYQLVARDRVVNTFRSYKRVGNIVDKARMAGLLDWSYIEDRTRNVYRTDGADTSPSDAIESTASSYQRELWEDQPYHVEAWVEKEALAGVVSRAAREVGINYFSCRGYVSQSEMYSSGRRFAWMVREGKRVVVLHLGDHDPSGIDMSRDITDRLNTFSRGQVTRGGIVVDRIALNMAQVDEYNPPPNFAKVTDARYADYEAQYGESSWELDALEPSVLNNLITSHVRRYRDEELWSAAEERQERERTQLTAISNSFEDVVEYLGA
jgi:hypothetical protein